MLLVESTKGKLIGKVKLLYSDYGLEPELQYVALALDESHISTPPATYDAAMVATANRVLGMYKCKGSGANCKFHLAPLKTQAHLTWTRGMSASLAERYTEPSAVTGDKCNAFSSCDTCIGATAGNIACGWCTEPVIYGNASAAPKFQCAGWEAGAAHGWKCYGQFRTATCTDFCCDSNGGGCSECAAGKSGFPTKDMCESTCPAHPPTDFPCDFDGVYRGLEIDLGYQEGEWLADFNKSSGKASFKYYGFRTHPGSYSYEGKLRCTPDQDGKLPLAQAGTFALTLTNQTVLHGRYSMGGNQAETEGLNWALAELGSTIPPFSFDAAMLGVNASVFGYTKCASYKAGVCKFHA